MASEASFLHEVKPIEHRALPSRFDLPHAIGFFFHDELANLVIDLERTGSLSVRFGLSDDKEAEIVDLQGEELWDWLIRTERDDVINDLTYRQLTAALVSDAAHFICESLLSSGKGKTQVAYTLLRKPFKENLLLLEWLCGSPGDFLQRFQGESIQPYILNRLSKDERRRIIRKASQAVDLPGIDDELLWAIRYDKEFPNNLETLWTKATHLVTSVKASATEPGNLNFVFSTLSEIEEQWEHYYFIVPPMLYYYVSIAEKVASRFVEWDSDLRSKQLFLRQLAFLRFTEEVSSTRNIHGSLDDLYRSCITLFPCKRCKREVSVTRENIDRVWLRAEVMCVGCKQLYSIWDIDIGNSK